VTRNTDFNKNNFDCLRLILASIVAFYHIDALTNISAFSAFGHLSPHFAVRGFFVISGLLIYRSYTRSSSVKSYFEKRVRRIYPAYFTVVVLAAVALFPFSTLPLSHYLGAGFWKYLAANLVFLNFAAATLPGVFATHINPAVDGALWTLKIEVAFYLLVPLLHYFCSRFGTKKVLVIAFGLSSLWKYGFWFLDLLYRARGGYAIDPSRSIYAELEVQFPAQLAYFCAGILLLLYFDKLKSHFISLSCITAILFLTDHFFTGEILDLFWISGFVFVFGFWRYFGNVSKYGDFSYGVYIVHWPILQILISLGATKLNPAIFLPLSLSLIGLAAFLMWHLVEKRFLANSSHYRQVAKKAAVAAMTVS
jgi:peptidoglycan/LPS O-acetylase OafA/YrhL